MDEIGCQARALVVLPVQELAAQVAKVFKKHCSRTNLKVALLGGSKPLHQEQSIIVKYSKSFLSNLHVLIFQIFCLIFMLLQFFS